MTAAINPVLERQDGGEAVGEVAAPFGLATRVSLPLARIGRAELDGVEQRLEQIAVLGDAADRGAAEAGAVIAPLAGDEARARAGAGKLVISERNLERRVHRLRARVAEEDAVELAGRELCQARCELKGRSVAGLEGGRVIEPGRLAADGLDDGRPAMAGVAAPEPRHGIEQGAPVRGVIVHALGAIDQPGTPLEGAIGGEGKPIGGELGSVEPCGERSVLRWHLAVRGQAEVRSYVALRIRPRAATCFKVL